MASKGRARRGTHVASVLATSPPVRQNETVAWGFARFGNGSHCHSVGGGCQLILLPSPAAADGRFVFHTEGWGERRGNTRAAGPVAARRQLTWAIT